jgi:hypothetical protein
MAFTGVTIEVVYPHHNPNEGRVIWNENFKNIKDAVSFSITGSTTAHTQVQGSSNIDVFSSGVTIPPIYTAYLKDDVVINSLSSTTMSATSYYLGDTLIDFGVQNFTQISVSAVGTGAYVGTGTPTITGYTIGEIYVTNFQSGNTITGVTINIDGVGVIPVEKYDIDVSGFTTLDIGDIQPSVNYYLTYDGSVLQFLETSPSSDPGTYTNPLAVPITLGGVEAGTVFNNTPYNAVFDDLFFPYLTPNFTSFAISSQSTILEKGDTLLGGPRTFTWSTSNPSYISPNTIKIKDIDGGNIIISTPSSGITNDGSESISISSIIKNSTNIQEYYRWQIRGTRTNNTEFTRNYTVYWRWRIYYGTDTGTTLTADGITGLTSSQLDTTIIPQTFAYAADGYKYLAIPSTFASPSLFKDGNTNLSIAMADVAEGYTAGTGTYKYLNVSVTNQYGATNTYRLYRTRNVLGGSINIITS